MTIQEAWRKPIIDKIIWWILVAAILVIGYLDFADVRLRNENTRLEALIKNMEYKRQLTEGR